MNQEVFAAVTDALERGEPAALVTIVVDHRLDAAARRRQDARLRRRPDRRHDRRRLLRERRVLEGARGHRPIAAPQLVHYELSDDFAQETGLICGGQMDVYIEPIEPSPELYVIGAGHVGFHLARAGARSRLPRPRRGRPREVREPRALPHSRRDRRRRHPDVDRADAVSRRTPTSSSSRAATRTISRRFAPSRRASCGISA